MNEWEYQEYKRIRMAINQVISDDNGNIRVTDDQVCGSRGASARVRSGAGGWPVSEQVN